MTPEHASTPDEFGELLARTPPPTTDELIAREKARLGPRYVVRESLYGGVEAVPRHEAIPPEERKPASVWDVLCWLFGRGR